jgi:hypothetical protein
MKNRLVVFGKQVSNQLIGILQSLKVQRNITLEEKIGRCFMDYKSQHLVLVMVPSEPIGEPYDMSAGSLA